MQEFAALLLLLLLLCPTARGEEGPVTRGGFVSALWESAGAVPYDAQTPFSDVSPRADYAPAVSWAAHQGLVLGTGEGRFQPERPITREEAAVLLRRWAALLEWDTFLPDGVAACNDYQDISPGPTTPSTGPATPACCPGPPADGWTPPAPSPRPRLRISSPPSPVRAGRDRALF